MFQPKKVLYNEDFSEFMRNLYFRWQDEKDYEDINNYARVIVEAIRQANGEDVVLTDIKPSKRPFGIKFKADGQPQEYLLKGTSRFCALEWL